MENKKFTDIYKDLWSVDCSSFTEQKKNLTYLSWSYAWNAVASRYDASYSVVRFDGKPYFFDESLGYYVETKVTIEWHTRNMQLFVMDGANNAMTNSSYTYTTKFGEKTVEKATMFEINTALMRCLTKNLAIFGLGINIYAWEDLPLIDDEWNSIQKKIEPKTTAPVKTNPTEKTESGLELHKCLKCWEEGMAKVFEWKYWPCYKCEHCDWYSKPNKITSKTTAPVKTNPIGWSAPAWFNKKELEMCIAEDSAFSKDAIEQLALDNWYKLAWPSRIMIDKYMNTSEL